MIEHFVEIFGGLALIYLALWHRRRPVETGWAVRERCDGVYFVVMRGRAR